MRTLIDCNRKIKYNIKDGKSKKEIKRLWNSPKGIAGRQFMLNISFPFTAALLCWMEKRIDNGAQPCVKQMSSFLIELTSKSTDTREVRALQKEYIVAYKFYFSVNRGKSTWKKKWCDHHRKPNDNNTNPKHDKHKSESLFETYHKTRHSLSTFPSLKP